MVSAFRRSLSFPIPISSKYSSSSSSQANQYYNRHLRSTSLPARLHPLLSHLHDAFHHLHLWHCEPTTSPAWLVDGLVRLDHLLDSFSDLLISQNTQNNLRSPCQGRTGCIDHLLDDFLRLADGHGTFRSAVDALQHQHSAAESAVRGRDAARIASCARSKRRVEKEIARLGAAVRHVSRSQPKLIIEDLAGAELAGIMREVAVVTATTSATVFEGIAAASSARSLIETRWLKLRKLVRRKLGRGADEEKRWEEGEDVEVLDESMRALEEKSERVFRCLVNIRVSLLNILSPC